MHLDGVLDATTYHTKVDEYKMRQRGITAEMKAHVNADETCLITATTVLDLAKRAKELFLNSKRPEKQQLLNFVFSNLKLDGKKLSATLREPFSTLLAVSHQPANLQLLGTLRTFDWLALSQEVQSLKLQSIEMRISLM